MYRKQSGPSRRDLPLSLDFRQLERLATPTTWRSHSHASLTEPGNETSKWYIHIYHSCLVLPQSSLENEVLRVEGNLDNFVSLTQEILLRFLREHFPTTIHSQVGHMTCHVTTHSLVSLSLLDASHSRPLECHCERYAARVCLKNGAT